MSVPFEAQLHTRNSGEPSQGVTSLAKFLTYTAQLGWGRHSGDGA